jgi:hypothetical protein
MEPLRIGNRDVPLAEPSKLDVLALLEAWVLHQRKPAALGRLKLATIALCAWAAVDGMPGRTRAERDARDEAQPPFGRLDDCDCDLLKLGRQVAEAYAEEGADLRELQAAGDRVAAGLFKQLMPRKELRQRAAGFSGEEAATPSDASSGSAPSTTGTPSPAGG